VLAVDRITATRLGLTRVVRDLEELLEATMIAVDLVSVAA
jgi:hypothetical protein